MAQTILVVDFGGQYNQLIARRVRECHVYSEIVPHTRALEAIREKKPAGIIFTGGPNSVYLPDSPTISPEVFDLGIPVLGICYGSQLMMHLLGGRVTVAPEREYGKTEVLVDPASELFRGVSPATVCWMSHNDYIEAAAPGFTITGHTTNCPVAAMEWPEKKLYAVQFHPEVLHTREGSKMLANFVHGVCGCAGRELGLPEELVSRQPFPGPGLAIRIVGEVTREKIKMVQEADAIWREELAASGEAKHLGQYFAALTNMRSVGVMGDERTYDYAVALRAVTTTDFMTAEPAYLPWELIAKVTSRIVNEVPHVNRVLYDCTGKPPATIEFE